MHAQRHEKDMIIRYLYIQWLLFYYPIIKLTIDIISVTLIVPSLFISDEQKAKSDRVEVPIIWLIIKIISDTLTFKSWFASPFATHCSSHVWLHVPKQ